MTDLTKEIKYVKGVGPNRAKLLNYLGIFTLEDLITYYPRTYEDRSISKKIIESADGQENLIEAIVVSKMSEIRIRKGMTLYKLIVRDETATCTITWFNQSYLKNMFRFGQTYKFFGKITNKSGKYEMNSPVYDLKENNKNTGKIIPIYSLTNGIAQNTIRGIIENGIKLANNELEETLPQYLLQEYNLLDINSSINKIHFPEDFNEFKKARKRLVFEELLSMQLALLELKNKNIEDKEGIVFDKKINLNDIINKLPFKLTKAQLKVLEEIDLDMEKQKPMNRLLQGDVGSR